MGVQVATRRDGSCLAYARWKEQYDRMVAEGLGERDKSGIAEFAFKDRHKHSADRA